MSRLFSILRHYGSFILMFTSIIAGCLLGCFWPQAQMLQPLGTIFINAMFCIAVPLVFVSIASSVANMSSMGRAGKLFSVTIVIFLLTATIAGAFACLCCHFFPLATANVVTSSTDSVQQTLSAQEMLVNFLTAPDFVALLSRRALLPLMIFAILFGFGIQMAGGAQTMTAKILKELTTCLLNMVKIVSYYAPIGFFGIFASLVSTYGPEIMGDYGRTLLSCYLISFAYLVIFFPVYAWIGAGSHGLKTMLRHIFGPAVTAFGTCSSVAAIPANMEAAKKSGISDEVANVVMPLGATMHMDGSAVAAVLKVLFLLSLFQMDISFGTLVAAIIVATLASVAMSGIPGGGGSGELLLCMVFFNDNMSIAFPIALALGNLVDPPATLLNAAGDYVATFLVERVIHGKNWHKSAIPQP